MQAIRIQAIIFIILTLTQSTVIEVKERSENKEERSLLLGEITLGLAGFLSAFLIGKYLTSKSPIHWKKDTDWETRFLQISKNQNLTMRFMNLLLDSFSMEVSNACMRIYYKRFEDSVKEIDLETGFDTKRADSLKASEWRKLVPKVGYCSDFFKYILSHGFLTKYLMNAKYALFYFRLSFLGHLRFAPDELKEFLHEMTDAINTNPLFKKIEQAHQNYFYITVNYLLDTEHNLKKNK